jgi:hypothetical protein
MKRSLLSISLLVAGMLIAAPPLLAQERFEDTARSTSAVPDPAQQVRDTARLLRGNDLAGLVRALVPPAQLQVMRGAYEVKRNEVTTAEDRAEFAEKIGKLTAPDAVDKLMAEIEPKLIEARPQAPGAIMMGLGALQVAISSPEAELTPEQRDALRIALPGITSWVNSTDFLSSDSMRRALTLVTDAARNSGIGNLDQLKMLSFEEALAKASSVLAASKQAVRLYGLDLDAIIDSTRVQVISIEGNTALVRATVTVFDAPISAEHELVLVEGHWYGKDAVDHMSFHHEEHSEG